MRPPLRRGCAWVALHAFAANDLASAAAPPNDSCENAISLEGAADSGRVLSGSTVDATPDGLNLCGENLIRSPGVWYLYRPSPDDGGDRIVQVSTCTNETDPAFDTAASVFSGFCSALQCVDGRDDDLECDAGEAHHSTLSWRATAGQRYYIQIHGSEPDHSGNFGLIVTETEPLEGGGPGTTSLASGVFPLSWPFLAMASVGFSILAS